MNPDHTGLKQSFENLRKADERLAPDFPATLASAKSRSIRTGPPRWVVVTTALVLALAGGTIKTHRSTQPSLQEAQSLVRWSSPTAFLLETPVVDIGKEKK